MPETGNIIIMAGVWPWLAIILAAALLPCTDSVPADILRTRNEASAGVWRPPVSFPGYLFPEQIDDAGGKGMLKGRHKSAVCFSGGGLRSFIASLGYLAALDDLGVLAEVGYSTGVSGGSWATLLYTYYKRGEEGMAGSDAELLGEIPFPEDITMDWLQRIPPKCARRSAATGLFKEIVAQVSMPTVFGRGVMPWTAEEREFVCVLFMLVHMSVVLDACFHCSGLKPPLDPCR